MQRFYTHTLRSSLIALFIVWFCAASVQAQQRDWQRKEVDWQAGSGKRIKAIYYPKDKTIPEKKTRVLRRGSQTVSSKTQSTRVLSTATATLSQPALPNAQAYDIDVDSPPVDGFVPWVAVSLTDRNSGDLELDAVPTSGVVGQYPSGVDPDTDYVIGLYDTGASAHVMGYESAGQAGLFSGGLITSNVSDIGGVIGSVTASISYPLGVFVDGLHAIDQDTLTLDRTDMVGETNVAIMVGQKPGSGPDLPTALGSPMSVYYTAVIYNDQPITVERDGETYTAPDIRIYEHDDSRIPAYPNKIPLELRPLGGVSVQYIPTVDLGLGGLGGDLGDLGGLLGGGGLSDFPPASPSVIIGNSAQSLFFFPGVDLYNNGESAVDKDRFMLDMGAQVSAVGSRIAARLRLDPDNPDFEVEIEDVTGAVVTYPGFYIEAIEIPALGQWLRFTNIPVTLLDVASPEGGTLDGIIGMNLFTEFDLVLRGGGLVSDEDPYLAFEPIHVDAVTSQDPNS